MAAVVLDNVPRMAIPSAARIEGAERVLTAPALAFVEDLTRRFRPRIDELLARRRVVQERYHKGDRPSFRSDTADVGRDDWKAGSIPADLQARFDRGRFDEARALFEQVATSDELQEFLTIPAHETLVNAS